MWPLNIQPKVLERQVFLQNRAGPTYLRKPGSKLYVGGFVALLGVSLSLNLFQLVQYARGKAAKVEEA